MTNLPECEQYLIESYPLNSFLPIGVKVTCKLTGEWVICDHHRSQHKNRAEAIGKLEALKEWLSSGRPIPREPCAHTTDILGGES